MELNRNLVSKLRLDDNFSRRLRKCILLFLKKGTDRVQAGMDSDSSDPMAPDEMYLMLQADMISIKNQEQVLQSEIDDIAAKFHSLLESCGLQPDSGTMAPPSTPSFMKNQTSSLTHVTNLETPTFMKLKSALASQLSDSSDNDTFAFISSPMVSLAESENTESDEILHDISSKTLIIDNNFNYIDSTSEVTDNTPIIEALPSMDENSPSSSSCGRMSSDGYPKSDDSSDNQIVPECYDLDKEFMSRLQYYSDFTLDRQKKINTMVSHLGHVSNGDITSAATEELFTRHVEGAESPVSPVKVTLKPTVTSGSSSDYLSTPSSHQRSRRERSHRHSRNSRKGMSNPLASSTRIEDSYSSSSSGRRSHAGISLVPRASSTMMDDTISMSSGSSGRRNRTGGSNPRACSTMLNESFLSSGSSNSRGSSRQRSSSIPMANSTMISEAIAEVPSIIEPSIAIATHGSKNSVCNSDEDLESIYTWSIHDDGGSDSNINLEQSYMKNITNSHQKGVSNKPPLPPCKRVRSGSVSSRDSDTSNKVCQDQNLHKLFGETCSKDILERISAIEPNATCRNEALLVESMYDDDEYALPRANTLPRSSTKMNLKDKSGGSSSSAKVKDKSSGSSSMEARRASLPDLYSVCVESIDDFHSVPDSLDSDSEADDNEISVLPERMQCAGKSSSSGEKDSSVSVSQLDSSQAMSPGQEVVKDSLIDAILTDSPNSVSSGGINAPHNSPGTNCSSSSKVSCSTTSDAKSSDSNINMRAPRVTLLPRNITESPKLQNVKLPQASAGEVFKVPKQSQPLRKLFRFRRNKSKTPDLKIAVPRQEPTAVHNDVQSKRELFPSGASTLTQEPKLLDKKAVIKKFKRFSDNFNKRDRSGKVKIQTLANL